MTAERDKEIPSWYRSGLGLEWLSRQEFRIDGQEFLIPKTLSALVGGSNEERADQLYLGKTPAIIERYLTYLRANKPKNIVELGIYQGGSVAYLQLLAKPRRLLAMELCTDPLPKLDRFIADRGLGESVRVELGVDQGDAPTVRRHVTEHFGEGRQVHAVFDDASHLLAPTRTSFEVLFPRLRPGGVYIVEDYAATHIGATQWLEEAAAGSFQANYMLEHCVKNMLDANREPLHQLAVEAMLASIAAPKIVKKVVADRHWLMIFRGQADIGDMDAFDLRALANDHFGLAQSRPDAAISAIIDSVSTLPAGAGPRHHASGGQPAAPDRAQPDLPAAV